MRLQRIDDGSFAAIEGGSLSRKVSCRSAGFDMPGKLLENNGYMVYVLYLRIEDTHT